MLLGFQPVLSFNTMGCTAFSVFVTFPSWTRRLLMLGMMIRIEWRDDVVTSKIVCKYAQHEEARCQEKSHTRTRIILILSTWTKRKLKRGYTVWHIPFNLFLYRRKLFFWYQSHGVACDDNLFIGRNHTNRHLGIGRRDDSFLATNLVCFGVHLHTQEL